MEKDQVNLFLNTTAELFPVEDLQQIKNFMEENPDKAQLALGLKYKRPKTATILAITLGGWAIDRIYLNQPLTAIVKVFTCSGFWVWYFWDIFSAAKRARKYNKELLFNAVGF
jgi:TM2 domain-containing membrane protein YozV